MNRAALQVKYPVHRGQDLLVHSLRYAHIEDQTVQPIRKQKLDVLKALRELVENATTVALPLAMYKTVR